MISKISSRVGARRIFVVRPSMPTPTPTSTNTPTPTLTSTPTPTETPVELINPILISENDEYLSVGTDEYLKFFEP